MAPRWKEKNEALACVIMEETLCFENENPEVISSLEKKREYATLSTSQLNILAKTNWPRNSTLCGIYKLRF